MYSARCEGPLSSAEPRANGANVTITESVKASLRDSGSLKEAFTDRGLAPTRSWNRVGT